MPLKESSYMPGRIALAGVLIAALFWVAETLIHSFVFEPGEADLLGGLLPSEPNEIWMRLVIFSLIIGSGVYAQRTVSRLKGAEELLRASEKRYREIVETAEEGVLVLDRDGRASFVNGKMTEMLGRAGEDIKGMRLADFMEKGEAEAARDKLESVERGGKGQHDLRFRRRDGQDLWALVTATPYSGEPGGCAGTLCMITDITGRKRSEIELGERVEELERFRKATVEREMRIKDLRDTVARLEKLLGSKVPTERG